MARSHSPGELEDFFKEFEDIESNKEGEEDEEGSHCKTPDEGEQEAAWLHKAGYGFLVNRYEAGKELKEEEIEALTSQLPSNHAAVLIKRIDTLNATLRKKQKYTTKIDVRNIFPQQTERQKVVFHSEVVEEPSPTSTTTKTQPPIRPTTLPRGMKLLTNGDSVWSKQNTKSDSETINPAHNFIFEFRKQPSYSLDSEQNTCEKEEAIFESISSEGQMSRARSLTHDSVFSINSTRSKSSSCDTLDSIDSGLDSTSSGKEHLGSKDSLDNQISDSSNSKVPVAYEIGQFSPDDGDEVVFCETVYDSDLICSPFGSPLLSKEDVPPSLVAFRKWSNTLKDKLPRSPVSPRSEILHPEWSVNRQNRASKGLSGSFVKNKAGYSMSGVSEEVHDNGESGIEMLSVQQKQDFRRTDRRLSQLSPISDSDITFELALEENGNSSLFTDANLPKSTSNDNLPNFILCEDKLGVTHIHDISELDMTYVRNLALLELTSLFDEHNIVYSRRRSKVRNKDGGLFGVSLQMIMENDQKLKSYTKIPLALEAMLTYLLKNCLDTEGILRVPGSATRVKQLRHEIEEKFYHGTFIWADDLTPNDVASLMKQFLRELPVPLLTEDYFEAFAQIQNLPDIKLQVRALNLLILVLPDFHRDTLHALLEFLGQVISHQNTNKMGLNNVSMIMAPNLFMAPKVNKQKASRELEFKMAAGTSNIMKMMIKYRDILWTVPSFLMTHVRRQYELEVIRKNRDKTKMKFLAKKDKTEVYKKPAIKHESDFQDGVIRVQAPSLTKSSMAFQLSDHMTAGDIVAKFRLSEGSQTWNPRKHAQRHGDVTVDPRNFTSAGDNTFLFEIGGNIGERCLPNNTNMMALYTVNPNAEWMIRQRTR